MGAPPRPVGADTQSVLADFGFSAAEVDALKGAGVVGAA
jgi:crotonobetainyl-CoA:carnitine CoA-transferase CaiB-like acyl-CoA transferase